MQAQRKPRIRCVSKNTIEQWQFEEGVNAIRRDACEDDIANRWPTTGYPRIDAIARAHIAEQTAFDESTPTRQPAAVVEAMVRRAVGDEPWQLVAVEPSGDDRTVVRNLRTQKSRCVAWVEGRRLPPPGSVVAMRIGRLEVPDVRVATLPVEFGGRPAVRRLVSALLRAYGRSDYKTWLDFMGGIGGRVVLEYGLDALWERARAESRRPAG